MVLAAAPAGASVVIDAQRVTLTAHGAGAVIERFPLRMSFTDANGRTVLSQVANTGQPPLAQSGADPVPGGGEGMAAQALYAPLAFTVGAGVDTQQPGFLWGGNLLLGLRAGVQYSARDAVGAAPSGDGVVLDVTTSDPSGRHLAVTVAPDGAGAIHVSARPSSSVGVGAMADSFASDAGEAFHGFGGRHNALDERGNAFYSWVEQENVGAGPFQPVADAIPGGGSSTYLFPNGPTAAYYVQPQFISSHPYGFLADRSELARFRMASDLPDAWHVDVAAPGLDYVVVPGDGAAAVGGLTAITGRQRQPPSWGSGPMFDRLSTPFTETAASFEAKVRDDIANIARYRLPLKAYRIEGWALLPAETVRSLVAELHRRGIKALLYFRAFASADTGGTEQPEVFSQALANGYFAKTRTGQPYLFSGNFGNPAGLIDFTNPAALRWWQGRIRAALDLGADGFMQDFGEQGQLDMVFANGETGVTMHNRYPVLYHRATRELLDSYAAEHPGRDFWFFTRTGYSGRPGAPAYESANFPGDETTDWSRSSGLASQVTDMLNRAVGGAVGYGTDIGGYIDYHTPATTKELFLRWAEMAALSPVFRLHGSANAGTHPPWMYDAETVSAYRALSQLHDHAAPLILRLWREAAATGMPITRPLWLAYPNDPTAVRQDQEWLLGPHVLVAPVVEQGATSRSVYFPIGCWEDPETGAVVQGPRTLVVAAVLTKLPYYFHCHTVPFKPVARTINVRLLAGCARRGLRASVRGPDARSVRRVDYYARGRRVARSSSRPFKRTIARSRFSSRRPKLTARVLMRDGRRLTLTRRFACR
ncbi:MAG: sulfoquinovosidase [Solirubrobacteraceae bacterium]|nr:sulfoquinovosidase [Solirubrobacteraceae bacterium]